MGKREVGLKRTKGKSMAGHVGHIQWLCVCVCVRAGDHPSHRWLPAAILCDTGQKEAGWVMWSLNDGRQSWNECVAQCVSCSWCWTRPQLLVCRLQNHSDTTSGGFHGDCSNWDKRALSLVHFHASLCARTVCVHRFATMHKMRYTIGSKASSLLHRVLREEVYLLLIKQYLTNALFC